MANSSATPPRRKVFRGMALPERPSFVLESAADPDRVEEFVGAASLPGLVALQFAVDGFTADTMPILFSTVLSAEDKVRFDTFCSDPDNGVGIETLVEIATYLIEEYTARPTEPSST